MRGLSCEFYADESDLAALLREFPSLGDFKYVQICSRVNESNVVFTGDATGLLPDAIVSRDKPTRRHSFLIMDEQQEVYSRDIVLADGTGKITIVDQNQNPNSVVLAFGGDAGDQTLLMSDINTVGDTDEARELHKSFKKLVASRAKRVGAKGKPFRLMPGAIAKAKLGWRLARGKGWHRSTDDVIPAQQLATL